MLADVNAYVQMWTHSSGPSVSRARPPCLPERGSGLEAGEAVEVEVEVEVEVGAGMEEVVVPCGTQLPLPAASHGPTSRSLKWRTPCA
jgi:hypothetical protein